MNSWKLNGIAGHLTRCAIIKKLNIFDFIEDVKVDAENRDENLEAGYKCTLFNKYKEYDYDLNYDYYIKECYNIIDKLK